MPSVSGGINGIQQAALKAKLRPLPGRRMGPMGPGTGGGGKHRLGGGARIKKNDGVSAFGVEHGGSENA